MTHRRRDVADIVKTITVRRGKSGYGFTVQGDCPSKFSHVMEGSPAYTAGIKAGDHLLAINGVDVTRLSHDGVIYNLAQGGSHVTLKVAMKREKTRPHYPRAQSSGGFQRRAMVLSSASLPSRNFRDDSSSAKQTIARHDTGSTKHTIITRSHRMGLQHGQKLLHQSSGAIPASIQEEELQEAYVYYMDTVDMPSDVSRVQSLRKCVHYCLHAHPKQLVRLFISSSNVQLFDMDGANILTLAAGHIVFCGLSCDDQKFFGLVVNMYSNQTVGGHCYVFKVDPDLQVHANHAPILAVSGERCGPMNCTKFPREALPVVKSISSLNLKTPPYNATKTSSSLLKRKASSKEFPLVTDRRASLPTQRSTANGSLFHNSDNSSEGSNDSLLNSKLRNLSNSLDKLDAEAVDIRDTLVPAESVDDINTSGSRKDRNELWRSGVDIIFQDNQAQKYFQTYAKSIFADENLDFYLDVEKFRLVEDERERMEKAEDMMRVYIEQDDLGFVAPGEDDNNRKTINIDSETSKAIKNSFIEAPNDLFDAAQKHVYKLLKDDIYPKWCQSEMFVEQVKEANKEKEKLSKKVNPGKLWKKIFKKN